MCGVYNNNYKFLQVEDGLGYHTAYYGTNQGGFKFLQPGELMAVVLCDGADDVGHTKPQP